MKARWVFKGLKILVLIALAVTLFSYVVMLLWNWLVPDLFSGPVITFVQAFGLLVLFRILFGGFHRRGGRRCGPHWRARMHARWEEMTPEEQEKFKEGFGRRSRRREAPPEAETPA